MTRNEIGRKLDGLLATWREVTNEHGSPDRWLHAELSMLVEEAVQEEREDCADICDTEDHAWKCASKIRQKVDK